MSHIKIFKGESVVLKYQAFSDAGIPEDFTGGTLFFILKVSPGDDTALYNQTIENFDAPATGVQYISIDSIVTAALTAGYCRAQIKYVNGANGVNFTEQFIIEISNTLF